VSTVAYRLVPIDGVVAYLSDHMTLRSSWLMPRTYVPARAEPAPAGARQRWFPREKPVGNLLATVSAPYSWVSSAIF